jgi:xanthine dehydrogenase accessory factor
VPASSGAEVGIAVSGNEVVGGTAEVVGARTLDGVTQTLSPAARQALGSALRLWAPGGVGVVRVLDRRGLGSVEPGQILVANGVGELAGSVYLGALDAVAVPLATAALTAPDTRSARIAEAPAVAAGLACGGSATLLAHPLPTDVAEALGHALARGRPAALASSADGRRQLALTGPELAEIHGGLGSSGADDAVVAIAGRLLRRGATATERIVEGGLDVLLDLWVPVPTVLVVGSGVIGDALLAQAELLGWAGNRVTGLDEAREAVKDFTDADVLVLLDHAGAFDAVLVEGLRRGHGFIGALGSRRTQAERRQRLTAAGLTAQELMGLHGPVGLDLGARTPEETAVSIVAEVLAVRAGRDGAALAGTDGRIGL